MAPFSYLFLFFSSIELLATDPIQRIDNMLFDIKELRKHYEYVIQEKDKENNLLQNKIQQNQQTILSLKSQINRLKNLQKSKRLTTVKTVFISKICENENKFPKLKLQK